MYSLWQQIILMLIEMNDVEPNWNQNKGISLFYENK